MKRRLFICSGLISLLNVATIKREESSENQYDDYLVIFAEKDTPFYQSNKKLGQIAGFSKVYPVSTLYDAVDEEIVDELYFFSHYEVLPRLKGRYLNAKWYLIEEGLSSYFKYYQFEKEITSCKFLFLHKKLDFMGRENKKLDPIETRDIKKTLSLFRGDLKKIPFGEADKVLLFIGQYIFTEAKDEKFILNLYVETIKKLLSFSYKIVFKTHPRHPRPFLMELKDQIGSENFFFLDDLLPVEIYNYPFVSILSVTSGALLTYSHLYEMPAFCQVTPELLNGLFHADRFYGEMVSHYIPDIQRLYELGNVESMSPDECRRELWTVFCSFIEAKPVLSENTALVYKSEIMTNNVRKKRGLDENCNLDNFHLEKLHYELRESLKTETSELKESVEIAFRELNRKLEDQKKVMNLLQELLGKIPESFEKHKNITYLLHNKNKIYFDYWKSCFILFFCRGKKRFHYLSKRDKLYNHIRDIRRFLKREYFE